MRICIGTSKRENRRILEQVAKYPRLYLALRELRIIWTGYHDRHVDKIKSMFAKYRLVERWCNCSFTFYKLWENARTDHSNKTNRVCAMTEEVTTFEKTHNLSDASELKFYYYGNFYVSLRHENILSALRMFCNFLHLLQIIAGFLSYRYLRMKRIILLSNKYYFLYNEVPLIFIYERCSINLSKYIFIYIYIYIYYYSVLFLFLNNNLFVSSRPAMKSLIINMF